MDQIEVRIFALESGEEPFTEWHKKLKDKRAQALVDVRIARVRTGNFGDCKSVGEDVYELRIDYGPGYRVYFGKIASTIILLLCGGDKSSQDEDIRKAKTYWREFLESQGEDDEQEEDDQLPESSA
jgi:putative addiction module killer protein